MIRYLINTLNKNGKINKEIYGHFAEHLGRCIYNGLFVGETSSIPNTNGMRNDVVKALKMIKIPVLRWPGGCFADEYHWKDAVGPVKKRKKIINTNWGGVVEDNSFGTHEFLELCRQLDCEPYICGNLGSGTVQEMSEWVEYINFDGISPMSDWRKENGRSEAWSLRYFGIGNENWGCGGNMTPEYYANEYRRYQTYTKNYNGKNLFKIACGPNGNDYNWTDVLMKQAGNYMDGLSLHYYTSPRNDWREKGSATIFDEKQYYITLKNSFLMDELITSHASIMDKYDREKRIALIVDEWGTWYDVEPGTNPGFLFQQNTMRDALVAGINFNIFNKHCDRVKMANIAQMVNVLQSVILTDGSEMLLTPTYYAFKMFNVHHDAQLVDSFIETTFTGTDDVNIPQISESASIDKQGNLNITLCNLDAKKEQKIDATIIDMPFKNINGCILNNEIHEYNTFENKDLVTIKDFSKFEITDNGFTTEIPSHSIVRLTLS